MLAGQTRAAVPNARTVVKAERRQLLDQMTTMQLFGYITYRHRVFLLAVGYPIAATLLLVLHYR